MAHSSVVSGVTEITSRVMISSSRGSGVAAVSSRDPAWTDLAFTYAHNPHYTLQLLIDSLQDLAEVLLEDIGDLRRP